MKTKKQLIFAIVALLMLGLIASACGSYPHHTVGMQIPNTDFDVNVDMSNLSEMDFSFHGHEFWMELLDHVERVELHDGFIRYYGYHHQWNGTRQHGSLDLSLESENGVLVAQIIALDIPGVEITDPLIARINAEMRSELSWLGYGPDVKVTFHDVRVTTETISMRIRVDLDL